MGALKLPQRIVATRANIHLCARIGVKLNGEDLGNDCVAYDVPAGTVVLRDLRGGETKRTGAVEPYWR